MHATHADVETNGILQWFLCRTVGSIEWLMLWCVCFLQGIAMAEIVSSLPSSGGPYFW